MNTFGNSPDGMPVRTWVGRNAIPLSVAGFASFWLGTYAATGRPVVSALVAAAGTVLAYAGISRWAVKAPDPYNNVFVTGYSPVQGSKDVILHGTLFVLSGPIGRGLSGNSIKAYSRQFVVPGSVVSGVEGGLKAGPGRSNTGATVLDVVSLTATGAYLAQGDKILERPGVLELKKVRSGCNQKLDHWYAHQLDNAGGELITRPILSLGGFKNTLAPPPSL